MLTNLLFSTFIIVFQEVLGFSLLADGMFLLYRFWLLQLS